MNPNGNAALAILDRLKDGGPYAIHELNIAGYSENNLATRMSECHAAGLVVGRRRKGQAVKEWRLTTPEERKEIRLKTDGIKPATRKCPNCYGTGRVAA